MITDAQKTLTDPQAKFEDYAQISTQLADSISNAQQKLHPVQAETSPQIESLNRLMEMAQQTRQNVDDKSDLWKEFIRRLHEINELHDEARKPLTSVQESGRKPASEAQKAVEFLNVSNLVI